MKFFGLKLIVFIMITLVALFLSICANACPNGKSAPKSLAGGKMVLILHALPSSFSGNYPNQGAIVQNYSLGVGKNKKISAVGYGDKLHSTIEAKYTYRRKNKHKSIERYTDANGNVIKTVYSFESTKTGTWIRSIGNNLISSGYFIFNEDTSESQPLAKSSSSGITVALSIINADSNDLPKEAYPAEGSVVHQSYFNNGRYSSKSFGVGTVEHNGTYTYQRISDTVAVESTLQTIPSLKHTAPFTMIYIYETAYSGRWYQNYSNGLIMFSGNFTIFPTSSEEQPE